MFSFVKHNYVWSQDYSVVKGNFCCKTLLLLLYIISVVISELIRYFCPETLFLSQDKIAGVRHFRTIQDNVLCYKYPTFCCNCRLFWLYKKKYVLGKKIYSMLCILLKSK